MALYAKFRLSIPRRHQATVEDPAKRPFGRISTTVARESTIKVNRHDRGSLTAHMEAGVV